MGLMKFSKKSAEPAAPENQIHESSASDNDQVKTDADFQEVPAGAVEKGNIFEQGGKNYRTLGRWDTILILFTNQLGLGILSLPSTIKTLGIVPGIIAIIGIGFLSWYSAFELLQFYSKHPNVVSIVEMTRIVGGPWFESIAGVVMMIQVVFIVASAVVTLSVALNTLSNHGTCTVVFILVSCIGCYILSIPRTMKFVSKAGIPNAVSVVGACMVVLISLAVSGPNNKPDDWSRNIVIVGHPSFRDGLNACLRVVFSYAGTFTFVSYMAEMKDPARDFGFSLAVLEIGSTVFYVIMAVVLYCLSADLTTSPVLSAAATIPAKVAYGIVLPAVIATALSIGHTGCKYLYVAALRKMNALNQVTDNSVKSWTTWVISVSAFWILIFTISNVIPIFDSILSITSATTIPWFTYGFAAIFWFYSNWDVKFSNWRKISLSIVNVLIICATLFLNAGGLWAAITELMDLFDKGDGIGGTGPAVEGIAVEDHVSPVCDLGNLIGNDDTPVNALCGDTAGVLREYAVYEDRYLVKIPEYLSWEEGSTLACAGLTAWTALDALPESSRTGSALLQGTGGVSMFAVLLCEAASLQSIITSSYDAKIESIKKLGSRVEGINYKTTPDQGAEVQHLTNGTGVDFAINNSGPGSIPHYIGVLRKRGGTVSLVGVLAGYATEWEPSAIIALMGKTTKLKGMMAGSERDFQDLCQFLEEKKVSISPITDRVFSFHESEDAFNYLYSGKHIGKVDIKI